MTVEIFKNVNKSSNNKLFLSQLFKLTNDAVLILDYHILTNRQIHPPYTNSYYQTCALIGSTTKLFKQSEWKYENYLIREWLALIQNKTDSLG